MSELPNFKIFNSTGEKPSSDKNNVNANIFNSAEEKKQEKNNVKTNIINIILYALSLVVALGLNDLILTIFESFKWSNHIIAKTTYVIFILFLTIWLAYYFGTTVKGS